MDKQEEKRTWEKGVERKVKLNTVPKARMISIENHVVNWPPVPATLCTVSIQVLKNNKLHSSIRGT